MESYTYHSPEGDRPMFAKAAPQNGRVDLYSKDSSGNDVLDIGNCSVEEREGGCSKVTEPKESKKEDSKK
jgi:hypothetical protein